MTAAIFLWRYAPVCDGGFGGIAELVSDIEDGGIAEGAIAAGGAEGGGPAAPLRLGSDPSCTASVPVRRGSDPACPWSCRRTD